MPEELITAREVARALGISVETVWRYTREKKIPFLELGNRQYRYILADVIKALHYSDLVREENKQYPTNKPGSFTYQDYLKLPDEPGYRFEVLEGNLVREPSPNVIHQRVSRRLQRTLEDHFQKVDPRGEVFDAPLDVSWDETNVVQPDLFYVPGKQREIILETHIAGSPHLIVEILSSFNKGKDRVRKMQIYQKAGVQHFWIVDPEEQSLVCFSLQNQVYALVTSGLEETTVVHPDFPNLTINLTDLWQ